MTDYSINFNTSFQPNAASLAGMLMLIFVDKRANARRDQAEPPLIFNTGPHNLPDTTVAIVQHFQHHVLTFARLKYSMKMAARVSF